MLPVLSTQLNDSMKVVLGLHGPDGCETFAEKVWACLFVLGTCAERDAVNLICGYRWQDGDAASFVKQRVPNAWVV